MKCPRTDIAIATSILKRPDHFFGTDLTRFLLTSYG
jgi:hypothetical protein